MEKSLYEQMGGTYTQQGDYLLPDLVVPVEDERFIGVWGQRRLRYLKQYHRVLYFNLLTTGNLHSHLADTDKQAEELFSRLVNEYAERENVTEQLKTNNQMIWIQRINNIRERVTEIVLVEISI